MRTIGWLILLFSVVLCVPFRAQADDDLSQDLGPTPTFFSDHSHDNEDVDGTLLKGSKSPDDIDTPPKTAQDAAAISALDQRQLGASESKDKPDPGTPAKPASTEIQDHTLLDP